MKNRNKSAIFFFFSAIIELVRELVISNMHNKFEKIAHYKHEIKITRNGYFSLNHRHIQITLAQIRLEFSNLNKHLSAKGCLNSSQCKCTEAVETPLHYFLKCKLYNMHRPIMMQTLSKYVNHV